MKSYNLEKVLFGHLIEKRRTTTLDVVAHFEKKGYTKQGVYKVLRRLRVQGKTLWVKTRVEVHLLWLHREIDRLASALLKKEIVFSRV